MFAWNVGLFAGTVSFGLGVFVMGIAYLCMVFSIAEVSSVVAFRGGAYGLARCTLGFYSGFIVGCCELLEYSLFATVNCMMVAQILAAEWPCLVPYTTLVCLLAQAFSFGFVIFGGRIFWHSVVVLAILLLYYFSAMTGANTTVLFWWQGFYHVRWVSTLLDGKPRGSLAALTASVLWATT